MAALAASTCHAAFSSVAVIGGGGAGVAAAAALLARGLDVTLFDRRPHLGGLWGNPDMLYPGLVTNLPKEVMAYSPSLPFDAALPSFVTSGDMAGYVQAAAAAQRVDPVARLRTEITDVRKPGGGKWTVTSCPAGGGAASTDEFDAVVVGNGHYNLPVVPAIPGAADFPGRTRHSCEYAGPDEFAGKAVLVVGGRASGADIARELSVLCAGRGDGAVVVADSTAPPSDALSSNRGGSGGGTGGSGFLRLAPRLERLDADGFAHFAGGAKAKVDEVVWAVGYEYAFPFLPSDGADGTPTVGVRDRAVSDLYEQVFHADDPSLSFVGLPHSVVPFPLMRLQAEWIAAVYAGAAPLPDAAARRRHAEARAEDRRRQGKRARDAHHLGDDQWDYCRRMAAYASDGGEVAPEVEDWLAVNEALYNDVRDHRPPFVGAHDGYRAREYRVGSYPKRDWRVLPEWLPGGCEI